MQRLTQMTTAPSLLSILLYSDGRPLPEKYLINGARIQDHINHIKKQIIPIPKSTSIKIPPHLKVLSLKAYL